MIFLLALFAVFLVAILYLVKMVLRDEEKKRTFRLDMAKLTGKDPDDIE